ncbi:MAG: response regulator [bacterium]|nr:response regulator [bacterium]
MKRTAIVVDDSMTTRLFTAKLLRAVRPDWEIMIAKHGEDALEQAAGKTLDFMLLDINMPGIDGFELGTKLREQSPDAWVTLISANIQQKVKERARELGFNFIEKPFDEEKLEGLVGDYEASR